VKALALSLFLFASPAMAEVTDVSAIVVMACDTPYVIAIAKSDGTYDAFLMSEFIADPAVQERAKALDGFLVNITDPDLCGLNVI
jgi:hypothetical protein